MESARKAEPARAGSATDISAPTALRAFEVPERIKITMRLLTAAAEAGARCPTNNEIAKAIGARSISTAAGCVATLETLGVIDVRRGNRARVVTIIATGKTTGGEIGRHPWRIGGKVWTDAEDVLLMDALAEGCSMREAATICQVALGEARHRFDALRRQMGRQAA